MNNEFKIKKLNNETRYILENASAGSTSAAMVAAVETSLGVLQRRVNGKKKSSKRAYMENQDFNGEYDDEAGMAESNLHTLARAVQGLIDTIKKDDNLPEWCQEKIAKAELMLVSVWDYMLSQKEQGIDPKQDMEESLDQSPENEMLQGRIGSVLIGLYDKGYTEEKIRMMQDRIAKHLGYEPDDKMFQSAFNSVLTSPEQGVAKEHNDTFDPKSHQYKTTMKHANNPGVQQRMAAHDIKPGIAGYRDRAAMLRDLERTGKLKDVDESDSNLSTATKRDLIANFKQEWHGPAVSVDQAIEDAIRPLLNVGVLKRSEIDAAEEFLYYVADMEQQPEEPYHDRDEDPMLGIHEGKIKGADGKACWKGKRYAGTKNGKDICIPVGENDQYMAELSEKLDSTLDEKSKSQKQARIMAAAAHDPAFAKRTGISQKVAREFNRADTGKDIKRLPMRVPKKKK